MCQCAVSRHCCANRTSAGRLRLSGQGGILGLSLAETVSELSLVRITQKVRRLVVPVINSVVDMGEWGRGKCM